MTRLRVGIAGVTGAVGEELLRLLTEREFPVAELRALASARSVGRTVSFAGADVPVVELTDENLADLDLVFFSCGGDRSRQFAATAVGHGAVVIDNSSAFRMDPAVPLVVPELNAEALDSHQGVIAVPNCTTIVFLMAAGPLHREARLTRAVVSSYQAASGAGATALSGYEAEVVAEQRGEAPAPTSFARVLHQNVIPHIDTFEPDGSTREERKLFDETRKILGDDEVAVASTCVRVPVKRAHAVSAALEFERPLSPERAREILSAQPGVVVVDAVDPTDYPTPLEVSGSLDVHVGRVRQDPSRPGGLLLWAVGDQLLKGAAWNALQIAESLIRRGRL